MPCPTAELLGVSRDGLAHALTTRTRQTPEGPIISPLNVRAATENRDSLAKIIYSKMFDWLVAAINAAIGEDKVGAFAQQQPLQHLAVVAATAAVVAAVAVAARYSRSSSQYEAAAAGFEKGGSSSKKVGMACTGPPPSF